MIGCSAAWVIIGLLAIFYFRTPAPFADPTDVVGSGELIGLVWPYFGIGLAIYIVSSLLVN